MSEKNLVICDRESLYAEGLAENVSMRSEFALNVYTFTSMEHIIRFQQKKNIHILVIDEKFLAEEREKLSAEQIFVLTKDSCKDLQEYEREIFKFQSSDVILAEIFEKYCESGTGSILKSNRKKKHRVVAVYSPIHRIGKTTFSIAFGKELAKHERVLYLNLEDYADHRFESGNQRNLGDLLYFMKQEKGDFALRIANTVGKMEDLDYIAPISNHMDLRGVTFSEWSNFLEELSKESIYETIILDLGESVQGLFDILEGCDKIYMPILSDESSVEKLHRYEDTVTFLQMNKIIQKTYQFETEDNMEECARRLAKEEW